jgi:hypothetical protein
MGNIKNFNFDKLKLQLSNDDYWDFYLANDESSIACSSMLSGSCFVVWYDFNNPNIYSGGSIFSLVSWTGATNNGVITDNYGLTGLDNGHIFYEKNPLDPTNQNLIDILTGTTLEIMSGETRLILNKVTGYTSDLSYEINQLEDNGYFYSNLCGGFYQGFFKLEGYEYEVLPTRVNDSWSAEFWIKPQNICLSSQTLNDLRPENKGFFFYMGTRSENKFWNQFSGNNTGCTFNCTKPIDCDDDVTDLCTIPKEIYQSITDLETGIEIPLSPPRVDIEQIKNDFLIYGRGSRGGRCAGPNDGLGKETVISYDRDEPYFIPRTREVITNNQNPFLVYGRGGRGGRCPGPNDGLGNQTVISFSGFTTKETFIDTKKDLNDNALGFRITDDGRLGYKFLTYSGGCVVEDGKRIYQEDLLVVEEYTNKPVINNNEWNYLVIKFVANYYDDCELKTKGQRLGDYYVYVNARLVKIFRDVPELMFKSIDDYKEKQIGVPFNISLGGGSQGLLESMTFDGPDMDDRNLTIEEHFGGTFIGGIADFKFNICNLEFCNIQNNYLLNRDRFNLIDEYLIDEENFYISDENGDVIITPSNNDINLVDDEDNFIVDNEDNLLTND